MAGGFYAPRKIVSKQALLRYVSFSCYQNCNWLGVFPFLYLNCKYWVASSGLGTEFCTSILLGAAGSVTAPVLLSALHTPFLTGDPALFSQPNHKRPDSGSGLVAPPPPKRRSAAGAGAGPDEGGAKRVSTLLGQSANGLGESLRSQAERQPQLFSLFLPRPTMT